MLTLLSSQGMPLTGNDKAAVDEARSEMRVARDWLAKPTSGNILFKNESAKRVCA